MLIQTITQHLQAQLLSYINQLIIDQNLQSVDNATYHALNQKIICIDISAFNMACKLLGKNELNLQIVGEILTQDNIIEHQPNLKFIWLNETLNLNDSDLNRAIVYADSNTKPAMHIVLRKQAKQNSFDQKNWKNWVDIQGDIHVAKALNDWLNHLSKDLPSLLQPLLKPLGLQVFIPAIANSLQGIFSGLQNYAQHTQQSVVDYLCHEKQVIITTTEFESFKTENFNLQDAVDRLEAKLKHFQKNDIIN